MKVDSYGDMLAQVKGKKLVAFEMFGSYQGEWIAVLEAGKNVELWKGYYGSCSGCDWLEGVGYSSEDGLTLAKAREYFKEDHAFAVMPKEMFNSLTVRAFQKIIPANIRTNIYTFKPKRLLKTITNYLKTEQADASKNN